jgi:AraC-like DNA-binding protein
MHESSICLHKSPESGWRFLCAAPYAAPAGRDFPPHTHTCWEWVYYRSGHIACNHGGERLDVGPGCLWITPPGVEHGEIALTAYANWWFFVEGPADAVFPRVVQDDVNSTLGRLLHLIMDELSLRRANTEGSTLPFLAEALLVAVRRAANEPTVPGARDLVREAEALWEDQPLLQVDAAARRLGVSGSGLRQAFATAGLGSPVARRTELRVRRALHLLRSSTLKLDAIAAACGFHSASHLSRHIKAGSGRAPGQLRDRS